MTIDGPAILEFPDTTVVVPPGAEARLEEAVGLAEALDLGEGANALAAAAMTAGSADAARCGPADAASGSNRPILLRRLKAIGRRRVRPARGPEPRQIRRGAACG